jgi:hypothetical protein
MLFRRASAVPRTVGVGVDSHTAWNAIEIETGARVGEPTELGKLADAWTCVRRRALTWRLPRRPSCGRHLAGLDVCSRLAQR